MGCWYYSKGDCQNQIGRTLIFQSCFGRNSFQSGCSELTIKSINKEKSGFCGHNLYGKGVVMYFVAT